MHSNELPRQYIITNDYPVNAKDFLLHLEQKLQQGARLIQLRRKKLTMQKYESLAKDALTLCHQYHATLLLNSKSETVSKLNADGVHLNSKQLLSLKQRPLPMLYLVAASTHNLKELIHAQKMNVDFVTLSPVFKTSSHPQTKSLGLEKFSELAKQSKLRIFALGGMLPEDLKKFQNNGAYGVAGITNFW